MTEQQARVIADAKDWYFKYYLVTDHDYQDSFTDAEKFLADSIAKLLNAEKTVEPGIRVLRDYPTGPVLDEPYILQPTDTSWRKESSL